MKKNILITIFCLLTNCTQTAIQSPPTNIADLQNKPEVIQNIIKNTQTNVFEIVTDRTQESDIEYNKPIPWDQLPFDLRNKNEVGIGTAFSIEKGKYLSCAHVFNLAHQIDKKKYYLKDQNGKIHQIKNITKYSEHRDVIEFTLENDVALGTLNIAKNFEIGEIIYSVGNALGDGISIRSGIISAESYEPEFGEWKNIRFSAAASGGNSGGPLVNQNGEVVGIIQAKSPNENLNWAYPINLLNDIKNNNAHIKVKQFFSPYQLRETYLIEYSEKLPQPIESLASKLTGKFEELINKNAKQFFKDHIKETFEADPKLQRYLNDQLIGKFWNQIVKNNHGQWESRMPSFTGLEFGDDEEMAIGQSNQDGLTSMQIHFIYQKNKQTTLKQIIDNPAQAITRVLQTTGLPARFAGIELKINNIKKSSHHYWIKDNLSRSWRIDFWRLKTFDLSFISACTPHPKGIACHMMPPITTELENYGAASLMIHELDSWIISPTGEFRQWEEFLTLDKNILPVNLKNLTASKNNNKITLAIAEQKIEFSAPTKIKRLELSIETSYSDKLPLKLYNAGFGFYDAFGKFSFFYLPQNPPIKDSFKTEIITWEKTIHLEDEFNGEVLQGSDEKKLILVSEKVGNKLTSLKPNINAKTKVYKVFCYSDLHTSNDELKKQCKDFQAAVSF